MTFEEKNRKEWNLQKFKEWLKKISVSCSKCGFKYEVSQEIIDSAELTGDEDKPFTVKHVVYSCTNPKCNNFFSYPDTAFVSEYIRKQTSSDNLS